MKKGKKKNLERELENRITPIYPNSDSEGDYLSYCSFHMHPGIIGKRHSRRKQCENKYCRHFNKLYLENGNGKKR